MPSIHVIAGAGRRIGEWCEQLWAAFKPVASMTRYMSKANFVNFMDDMLGWTAMQRYHGFHEFMLTARRNNSKKLGGVHRGA
jgi:hypothetical protein